MPKPKQKIKSLSADFVTFMKFISSEINQTLLSFSTVDLHPSIDVNDAVEKFKKSTASIEDFCKSYILSKMNNDKSFEVNHDMLYAQVRMLKRSLQKQTNN
ncbi:hypothetical protein [Cellulophaga baltica]|uniref:Uncharacterized protein n=1 Tax=Cellulophaga baltica 18 TaxID=1348584 RepID=A0AAU8RCG8_9FLAO|nr:hypothetical protein [Cellulophaga baltica]AIZ41047.1 hypothetical protein M666_05415 [Cellulophaga baltica 18]WFO14957.1 hypothetical protein M601_013735 [Cellulophaga baltica 4]